MMIPAPRRARLPSRTVCPASSDARDGAGVRAHDARELFKGRDAFEERDGGEDDTAVGREEREPSGTHEGGNLLDSLRIEGDGSHGARGGGGGRLA